jgi:hypothetical protein
MTHRMPVSGSLVTLIAWIAGTGLIGLLLWFPAHASRALGSCLAAWIYFLDISLGSLATLMLHRLVGGDWIVPIQRYLRSTLTALPLLVILFVPILVAAFHLFPWSRWMHADGPMAFKSEYLAAWPFVVRSVIAFGAWCSLAWLLRRGHPRMGVSAVGLIVYTATVTWAAVDWIASLEPRWSSSILGLVIVTGQGLAAFAFVTFCMTQRPLSDQSSAPHERGDLGNLLLTFVMTWAYLAFVQFLIVWAEDLPRETIWYVPRVLNNWRYLTLAVAFGQFALPFALLLFRRIKRHPRGLCAIALILLISHGLYVFWLIVPTLVPGGWDLAWTDPAALICVGAPWVWIFIRDLAISAQGRDDSVHAGAAGRAGALHVR